MNWLTAALVTGYISICEVRAPNAWQACESRWNWALGVLVPSPLSAAAVAIKRRRGASVEASKPSAKPASDPDT